MRLTLLLIPAAFLLLLFAACGDGAPKHADTTTSGTIQISVDETYRPVIEEQLKVFDSSYPQAHITINYKSEAECIKDFLDQKTSLVLVTRTLDSPELKYCAQKYIVPDQIALASDAVAVILNNASPDSLIGLAELRGILTGQYKKKYTVVFDNQGSSTVRFVQDSILKSQKLGANVYAAKSNPEVVNYVAKNPDAIGFVGLGYVSNDSDVATGSFISKVTVAAVHNDSTQEFLKPYQAYIALRTYPLARKLYFIRNENYLGLATGFSTFLSNQRGQLVFHHAHMFPLRSEMVIRQASLNQNGTGR